MSSRLLCLLYFILYLWLELSSVQALATGSLQKASRYHNRLPQNRDLPLIATKNATIIGYGQTRVISQALSHRRLSWIPDGIKNAWASYLATVLVKILLQPFDTIKTIQQLSPDRYNILTTARQVVAKRGIQGLWAGTLVSAFGSSPSVAIYFGVFSSAKRHLATALPLEYRFLAVALAAAVGNTVACVFRVPYEVIKQRLQSGLDTTILAAITNSFALQQGGALGIFQGGKLVAQIIRDVPYAMITAVSYDLLQRYLFQARIATATAAASVDAAKSSSTAKKTAADKDKKQLKPAPAARSQHQWQDAFCGACAGGLGTLLTTPMDIIKTRLMASTRREDAQSFLQAIQVIYREQGGLSAFFLGSSSRLLHKIPANGFFFLFYEMFRFVLGAVETRSEQ